MLDKKILLELEDYIQLHINNLEMVMYKSSEVIENKILQESIQQIELENFIHKHRKPAFKQILFHFIDKKGLTDPEIYKKAGIDRKHFSKIRTNSDYHPSKMTIIALALALELNTSEMDELLSSGGFSLSESDTFDLVIQFCIEKGIYDIFDVNQALEYFSLKPLGGTF